MKIIFYNFLVYLLASFVGYSDASGYYWRDYYGVIPDDAFQGGMDINGDPIYIGQTYDNNDRLIPSKIYRTSKKNYYELLGAEHKTSKQVKILCTVNPEQLKWIETNKEGIKSVANSQNLILGGYEPGVTTYIGRAPYNNAVLVGKIQDNIQQDNIPGGPKSGLWTTANGKSLYFSKFEVLGIN